MATSIDLELAYDWVKRCGSIASKLSADVGYLGTGHAPESAWTASGDDVRDVADKIADQLDRAPTVLELARGHVETCHSALVELNRNNVALNRNNVAGYRAGGKLYLHAHGAIVGIASTLCTVVRGWDDRVEVPLRGEPVPQVERSLLRENLPECAKWFITDEMWVSYDEIQELLRHAERESILAIATAADKPASVTTQFSQGSAVAETVATGLRPAGSIPPERRSAPLTAEEVRIAAGESLKSKPSDWIKTAGIPYEMTPNRKYIVDTQWVPALKQG